MRNKNILKNLLTTASAIAIITGGTNNALAVAARTVIADPATTSSGAGLDQTGGANVAFAAGSTLQYTINSTVTAAGASILALDVNATVLPLLVTTGNTTLGSVVDVATGGGSVSTRVSGGSNLTLTGTGSGGLGFVAANNVYTALGNITLNGSTSRLTVNNSALLANAKDPITLKSAVVLSNGGGGLNVITPLEVIHAKSFAAIKDINIGRAAVGKITAIDSTLILDASGDVKGAGAAVDIDVLKAAGSVINFNTADSGIVFKNTDNAQDVKFTLAADLAPILAGVSTDVTGEVTVESAAAGKTLTIDGANLGVDNTHRLKEVVISGGEEIIVNSKIFAKEVRVDGAGARNVTAAIDTGAGGILSVNGGGNTTLAAVTSDTVAINGGGKRMLGVVTAIDVSIGAGAGAATFGAVTATNINFTGVRAVNFNDNVTSAINFQANDATIEVAAAKVITGDVSSTANVGTLNVLDRGGVDGKVENIKILEFRGEGEVTGSISVKNLNLVGAAKEVEVAGNINVSNEIKFDTNDDNVLKVTAGNITGVVNFAKKGKVNLESAAAGFLDLGATFTGASKAGSELQINRNVRITDRSIDDVPITIAAAKTFEVNANAADITVALRNITLSAVDSILDFTNTHKNTAHKITLTGNLDPGGNKGIVVFDVKAAGSALEVTSAAPQTLGTKVNKLKELRIQGGLLREVAFRGNVDISNVDELNIKGDVKLVTDTASAAAIPVINIGENDGALPIAGGQVAARYIMDATGAVAKEIAKAAIGGGAVADANIDILSGTAVNFLAADSQLVFRNTNAGGANAIYTLRGNLVPTAGITAGNDLVGKVEIFSAAAGKKLTVKANGGETIGTDAAHRLNSLTISGGKEVAVVAQVFAKDIIVNHAGKTSFTRSINTGANGSLSVNGDGDANFAAVTSPTVTIDGTGTRTFGGAVKATTAVSINGDGDANLGAVTSPTVTINGNGARTLGTVNAATAVSINGGGNTTVGAVTTPTVMIDGNGARTVVGPVTATTVTINGNGARTLGAVNAATAVSINGGGNTTVGAVTTPTVTIGGNGARTLGAVTAPNVNIGGGAGVATFSGAVNANGVNFTGVRTVNFNEDVTSDIKFNKNNAEVKIAATKKITGNITGTRRNGAADGSGIVRFLGNGEITGAITNIAQLVVGAGDVIFSGGAHVIDEILPNGGGILTFKNGASLRGNITRNGANKLNLTLEKDFKFKGNIDVNTVALVTAAGKDATVELEGEINAPVKIAGQKGKVKIIDGDLKGNVDFAGADTVLTFYGSRVADTWNFTGQVANGGNGTVNVDAILNIPSASIAKFGTLKQINIKKASQLKLNIAIQTLLMQGTVNLEKDSTIYFASTGNINRFLRLHNAIDNVANKGTVILEAKGGIGSALIVRGGVGKNTVDPTKSFGSAAKPLELVQVTGDSPVRIRVNTYADKVDIDNGSEIEFNVLATKKLVLKRAVKKLQFNADTAITEIKANGVTAPVVVGSGVKFNGGEDYTGIASLTFLGAGELAGPVKNLKLMKVGAGDVYLSTAGAAYKIEKTEATGDKTLKFADKTSVTGDIDNPGALPLKLTLEGDFTFKGDIGATNAIGPITAAGKDASVKLEGNIKAAVKIDGKRAKVSIDKGDLTGDVDFSGADTQLTFDHAGVNHKFEGEFFNADRGTLNVSTSLVVKNAKPSFGDIKTTNIKGSESLTIELKDNNVSLFNTAGSSINFADASASLAFFNRSTDERTIRLSEALNGEGSLVLIAQKGDLVVSGGGDATHSIGTNAHRVSVLDFSGNNDIKVEVDTYVKEISGGASGGITFKEKVEADNLNLISNSIFNFEKDVEIKTVDFKVQDESINLGDNVNFKGSFTSDDGSAGLIKFEGNGSLIGSTTGEGIRALMAGAGDVTVKGNYKIGEITGNGTETITFKEGSDLTTSINSRGGEDAVKLKFEKESSISGSIGDGAPVGDIEVGDSQTKVYIGGTVNSGKVTLGKDAELSFNSKVSSGNVTLEKGASLSFYSDLKAPSLSLDENSRVYFINDGRIDASIIAAGPDGGEVILGGERQLLKQVGTQDKFVGKLTFDDAREKNTLHENIYVRNMIADNSNIEIQKSLEMHGSIAGNDSTLSLGNSTVTYKEGRATFTGNVTLNTTYVGTDGGKIVVSGRDAELNFATNTLNVVLTTDMTLAAAEQGKTFQLLNSENGGTIGGAPRDINNVTIQVKYIDGSDHRYMSWRWDPANYTLTSSAEVIEVLTEDLGDPVIARNIGNPASTGDAEQFQEDLSLMTSAQVREAVEDVLPTGGADEGTNIEVAQAAVQITAAAANSALQDISGRLTQLGAFNVPAANFPIAPATPPVPLPPVGNPPPALGVGAAGVGAAAGPAGAVTTPGAAAAAVAPATTGGAAPATGPTGGGGVANPGESANSPAASPGGGGSNTTTAPGEAPAGNAGGSEGSKPGEAPAGKKPAADSNQQEAEAWAIAAGDEGTRFGVWGMPYYSQGQQKVRGKTAGYKVKSYGGMIGFDSMINEDSVAGVALGMLNTNIKHQNEKRGNTTNASTYLATLYSSRALSPNWFIQGIISGTLTRIKNKDVRRMTNSLYQTAKSSYNSVSVGGEVMFGYNKLLTPSAIITPMAGLRYGHFNEGKYTETGTMRNLIVKGRKTDKIEGVLGARLSMVKAGYGFVFIPEVHAFVNQAFNAKAPKIDARMKGSVQPLPTRAIKPDSTLASVGGGLTIKDGANCEWGILGDINFAKNYSAVSGLLKVKVNF